MVKHIDLVPNIPSIYDADWNSALVQIQQPFLKLGKFDDAVETQIVSLQGHWTIILHWIIRKKWKSRHKIPISKPNDYEPLGEVYYRLLELCIQIHAMHPSGYLSASEWFSRIIQGERNEQYRLIFAIASKSRLTPTKGEASALLLCTSGKLKHFQNPYDPTKEPHAHKLIEKSIVYAQRHDFDYFAKDYWKPFIKAYSDWARDFRRPIWNVRYAKDGRLYRTSGRGKNKGLTIPLRK
jgi:hypothetical protein